ncbi:MAG: hypothetical protein OXI59_05825, partial [Gemmatimonadota bacterium]|nr:hypothetical protein [Gemmatimonadota bacterium]
MARDTHRWHAHFYDGEIAQPHTVQIEVLANGLEIIFSDRPSEIWTYGSFRQTEGFHSGELIRFEKSDTFGQALVIEDVQILEVIRERAPASGLSQSQASPVSGPSCRFFSRFYCVYYLAALWPYSARIHRRHRTHCARCLGRITWPIRCRAYRP